MPNPPTDTMALSMSQILGRFAREAPSIQLEAHRASADVYGQIYQKLAAEATKANGRPPNQQESEALAEIARSCTPAFRMPGLHAKVNLDVAYYSEKGWFFRRSSTTSTSTVTLEVDLEAAPLGPAAVYGAALPEGPTVVFDPAPLTEEQSIQCKLLMAHFPHEGASGVRSVKAFLQGRGNDWPAAEFTATNHDAWNGGRGDFTAIVLRDETVSPDWSSDDKKGRLWRGAMKALLVGAAFWDNLPDDDPEGEAKRTQYLEYVDSLKGPTEYFLTYLQALKYLETLEAPGK